MNITKVRCYDLEGNMLQDFESAKEASDKLNIPISNVSSCALGDSNYAVSYQFRKLRKGTPLKVGNVLKFLAGSKPIAVGKFWNKNLICVYNSIQEAADKNNLTEATINVSISRGQTIRGFKFVKIKNKM